MRVSGPPGRPGPHGYVSEFRDVWTTSGPRLSRHCGQQPALPRSSYGVEMSGRDSSTFATGALTRKSFGGRLLDAGEVGSRDGRPGMRLPASPPMVPPNDLPTFAGRRPEAIRRNYLSLAYPSLDHA